MTTTALEKLLVDHASAKRDGARLKLGDVKATFFVRIGSQSMTVDRVVSVELEGDLTTLISARGDITAVATTDVAAVKFEVPKKAAGLL